MIQTPYSEIEWSGTSTFQTVDDGVLTISESYEMLAQIELGLHHQDESDELPSDIMYSRFRVPDSSGVVWECESRFDASILIEKMVDLSRCCSDVVPLSKAEDCVSHAFGTSEVLSGVRTSSDDRFYRRLACDGKILEFQFKYTTLTFDLAFHTEDEGYLPTLYVKLQEGSLMDLDGAALGALCYETVPFMGDNCAYYNSENEFWQQNLVPSPLIFAKTSDNHAPNPNVQSG